MASPPATRFFVGNQGLQFSSVGGWIHAQALARGKGRSVPTEWFLQDIRD